MLIRDDRSMDLLNIQVSAAINDKPNGVFVALGSFILRDVNASLRTLKLSKQPFRLFLFISYRTLACNCHVTNGAHRP